MGSTEPSSSKHRAFSLVELLVVVGIIGVLIALLLPAVQKVREAANCLKCTVNLRNIGLASHHYLNIYDYFPPGGGWDGNGQCATFYRYFLPFLEETNNDGSRPVSGFLCPSRRNVSVGVKDDYAGKDAGYLFFAPIWANSTPTAGILTIEFALLDRAITMQRLQAADGASNTFLLVHKGLQPSGYAQPIPGGNNFLFDEGWGSAATDCYDVTRYPYALLRDSDQPHVMNALVTGFPDNWPGHVFLGSPHSSVPCLMADGSVHLRSYTHHHDISPWETNPPAEILLLVYLWDWNDGQAVAATE